MVYWVAFDLDGTIGSFESVMNLMTLFFPTVIEEVYRAPHWNGPEYEAITVPAAVKPRLRLAFEQFVGFMAEYEPHTQILRPGIVEIIGRLLTLRDANVIGGLMIYSNNSNPYALIFAHELLKAVMKVHREIFCPLVHWGHRLRDAELRGTPGIVLPLGHGPKRIQTIINAFTEDLHCGHYTAKVRHQQIKPSDIVFFDDQVHPDIARALPPQNYIHVQSYAHAASVEYLCTAFLKAYESQNIDMDSKFTREFAKIGMDLTSGETTIESIKAHSYTAAESPVNDTDAIMGRLDEIFKRQGGRRSRSLRSRSRRARSKIEKNRL